jgi:serine/threonine protein kinase
LLYECLTGEVPFHANNYLQIISQVLTHQPMPPSQLRPELGIPDAVEAVVMRAMEKDRALRYQTMAELERDLERLLAGDQNVGSPPLPEGVRAPASRPALRRWPLVLAAAAALVGGVALAVSRPGSSPSSLIAHAGPSLPARPSPAAPSGSAAAPQPASPATPAPHKLRARPERHAARPPEPASGGNLETSESVKRGVLPAGSREAYPQK